MTCTAFNVYNFLIKCARKTTFLKIQKVVGPLGSNKHNCISFIIIGSIIEKQS